MSTFHQRAFLNIEQLLIDLFCLTLAFPLALIPAWLLNLRIQPARLVWIPISFSILFLLVMVNRNLYDRTSFTYRDRILKSVVYASLIAALFSLVMLQFTLDTAGRDDFFAFYLLAVVLTISVRYLATRDETARAGGATPHVLMIGDCGLLSEYLYFHNKTGFTSQVVGCIPVGEDKPTGSVRHLGSLQDVEEILRSTVIDEVVVALPRETHPELRRVIHYCVSRGKTVKIAIPQIEDVSSYVDVLRIGTIPVVMYHDVRLNSVQSLMKRAMDIGVAVLLLAVLLLPMLPFLAPYVLSQGERRRLFASRRKMGLNGRVFHLHSYDLDGIDQPVARFLKWSGVAALPLLFNLLAGDISLVGPRMTSPEEHQRLLASEDGGGDEARRMSMKPGVTGLWYVRDFECAITREEEFGFDVEYMRRWSFAGDLRILSQSLLMGMLRRGTRGTMQAGE